MNDYIGVIALSFVALSLLIMASYFAYTIATDKT